MERRKIDIAKKKLKKIHKKNNKLIYKRDEERKKSQNAM